MKTIYMKNQGSNLSIRNAAIIAGIGVLLMAILAPIANFSIFSMWHSFLGLWNTTLHLNLIN